ncbi:tudor domain-containing protein 7B-like, partial [Hippocampus comes]|uniref:tudor domain-containing protein 7B-like n=1 Tax=Hippocampus comes TaxID=109280 RepID=UPI00094EA176
AVSSPPPEPSHLNENLDCGKGKVYNPQQVQNCIKEILSQYSNGFWLSKLPQIYKELYKQELPTEAIRDLETWKHICTVERTCGSNPSELLLYPAKEQTATTASAGVPPSIPPSDKPPQSPEHQRPQLKRSGSHPPPSESPPSPLPLSPPASLSPELKQKLEDLLQKYSSGLWAHALPKLFQDTYKVSREG